MNAPVLGFHRRIVRSVDPLASICPSGAKARQRTASEWPRKILSIRPVSTSQIRIVWSTLPLAAIVPSGWYATAQTGSWCPRKTRTSRAPARQYASQSTTGTGGIPGIPGGNEAGGGEATPGVAGLSAIVLSSGKDPGFLGLQKSAGATYNGLLTQSF